MARTLIPFLAVVLYCHLKFCEGRTLGCNTGTSSPQSEYFDLGYSLSEETLFWPGQKKFVLDQETIGWDTEHGYWFAAFSFCVAEHAGTHLDAPYHFYKEGWTVEQIPWEHLINVQGVVINVEEQVHKSTDPSKYLITVQDIINYEHQHGNCHEGGLVMFYTGWSKYWPNTIKYFGWDNSTSEARNNSINGIANFPAISEDAAKWLFTERHIVGIGIDTASADHGSDVSSPVHVYLAKKQVYNLENVANLHLVIGKTCRFFILPLNIVGGTGAPTRILAQCG